MMHDLAELAVLYMLNGPLHAVFILCIIYLFRRLIARWLRST